MRIQFNKSTKILAFSFALGDDFNFFVCTNNQIQLYDIKINQQKAKAIKTISIPSFSTKELPLVYFEPLANLVLYVDAHTGKVHPYFLNQYKKKPGKGMQPF
jgi:hypothetical protein